MDFVGTTEVLGNLGEFFGAFAVVATLVYLAIQVRHSKDSLEANTAALTAQTRQAAMETATAELLQLTAIPEIAIALSGMQPLTTSDHVRLDSFLAASMRGREFSWLQHKAGTIDESLWATELAVLHVYMDSFLIRQWWNKLGRHYSGPDFVEFVDELSTQIEPTNELWKAATNWSEDGIPQ